MAKQVHGGSNPASVRTPAAYLRVIDFRPWSRSDFTVKSTVDETSKNGLHRCPCECSGRAV